MLFGPDRVVACPACGAPARVFTLLTSNNFFDTAWTDGYVARPHHWEPPALCRCHRCRRFFWLADAVVLGSIQEGSPPPVVPEEWKNAPRVTGLDLDGLLGAIERGAANTPDRERLLRLQAFWASSHRNRNRRRKKDRQKTPADRRNMTALLALFTTRFAANGDPKDLLLCAEIRRQMGEPAEAIALIERIASWPEALAPFADEVTRQARAGSRVVAPV